MPHWELGHFPRLYGAAMAGRLTLAVLHGKVDKRSDLEKVFGDSARSSRRCGRRHSLG
ncbi:hypothetical protein NOVOSPHI9U_60066 [Novosphingobium sp. 9U]|nr:hypothetical protein NOVOSPHI9U_60066 [Novosphingobium sp. 9U]